MNTTTHDGKTELATVASVLNDATLKALTGGAQGMADRIGTIETADLGRLYAELCAVDNAFDMVQSVTKKAFVLRLCALNNKPDPMQVDRKAFGAMLEPLTVDAFKNRGVQQETARSTKSRMIDTLAKLQEDDIAARKLLELAAQDSALSDGVKAYKPNGPLTVKQVSKVLALTDGEAAEKAVNALAKVELPRAPARGEAKEGTRKDKGGAAKGKRAESVILNLDALETAYAKVIGHTESAKAARTWFGKLVKERGNSDALAMALVAVVEAYAAPVK